MGENSHLGLLRREVSLRPNRKLLSQEVYVRQKHRDVTLNQVIWASLSMELLRTENLRTGTKQREKAKVNKTQN